MLSIIIDINAIRGVTTVPADPDMQGARGRRGPPSRHDIVYNTWLISASNLSNWHGSIGRCAISTILIHSPTLGVVFSVH